MFVFTRKGRSFTDYSDRKNGTKQNLLTNNRYAYDFNDICIHRG